MPQSDYTFGDSDLAARRLELLGSTFQDTTRDFLRAAAPSKPALAVDLGSGTGHTTVLLRETLHPALTIAVDFSPAYVEQTRERAGDDGVEAIEADVLNLPERIGGAEVIFVRMLLTHLRDPLAAVALWRERLAPGGVLLLEEVESIATEELALARYLELQEEMLHANDNTLKIGAELDAALSDDPGLHGSEVVEFSPARRHRRADVRDELHDLARAPRGDRGARAGGARHDRQRPRPGRDGPRGRRPDHLAHAPDRPRPANRDPFAETRG